MPQDIYLHEFGSQVIEVFGQHVYHVGSSLTLKTGWRDVDVRVILPDEEWEAWGFGDPLQSCCDGKWTALCMAFSELGKRMTGLPIDFQIQKASDANDKFSAAQGCPRNALGFVPLRMKRLNDGSD